MDVVSLCGASGKYLQGSGYPLTYEIYPGHIRGSKTVPHEPANVEHHQLTWHRNFKHPSASMLCAMTMELLGLEKERIGGERQEYESKRSKIW